MSIPTIQTITHKCGHSEDRDLSDVAAGQRAGKAAWWAGRPCFTCFRKNSSRKLSKEVQSERDALRQEALDDQARSNLPILRGSDKQTPWATEIRFKLLRDAYEELVQDGGQSEADFEDTVLEPARGIGRAKWWIDNRDATSEMIIELLADPGLESDETENENPY